MRGLITANLKFLGKYPNDNDELIIAKRGSMTSGSTSFSSLDGIGSNIHVVGLDDLTIGQSANTTKLSLKHLVDQFSLQW